MRIEEISKDQTFLLATIFHQLPTEPYAKYAERVHSIESQLDRGLLRPAFLHRLIQPLQSSYTPLCGLHKILDAKIVHQAFILLATEVGIRMNSLIVAGRDKVGHETWDSSILNLRSLHGAWLRPEVFWDTFGKTLYAPQHGWSSEDYMAKWVREEDNCEACILSRIGGDLPTVLDLQMAIKSRTRTRSTRRRHEPRLTKLVDGWLKLWEAHYNPERWTQKLEWNRLRAERLKNVRKDLAKRKRRVAKEHKKSSQEDTRRKPSAVSAPPTNLVQQRTQDNIVSGLSRYRWANESEETIKVFLSPKPSNQATGQSPVESDNEDEVQIETTVHDAENDIIDCYAALISTPFLPGMDAKEHQHHTNRLSRHSVTMAPQQDGSAWPMVGDHKVQERLARSQSTKHRRPSNYSESVYSQDFEGVSGSTYVPPRQQWKPSNNLRRSNTTQQKRTSDQSWVTASVAPSATTIATSILKGKKLIKAERDDHRFDTIAEEPISPRNYGGKFTEHLVSPIQEYSRGRADTRNRSPVRSDAESPVSPLTPVNPLQGQVKSGKHSSRHETNHKDKPSRSRDHRSEMPSSSDRGDRNDRHDRGQSRPDLSSRLSKPFDGPTVEPDLLAKEVSNLRVRDTMATEVTRWSALYGSERDNIRNLEQELREGTYAASASKKSERKEKRRK